MKDLDYVKHIISIEANAVAQLLSHADAEFERAVILCRQCQGNIIVSGVGKSGFIAQKMAATYASIGIKSWWIHPNDADHGDIGRVTDKDVCILFSNSGETKEIINLANQIKSRNAKIISIVGKKNSTLGLLSDVVVYIGECVEAGLIKAIPTSSTTVSLVAADAIALATVGTNLSNDEFQKNHKGGSIGVKLSKVNVFMRSGSDCVIVSIHNRLLDVILAMTGAHTGAAIVVDQDHVVGIITDGDLRRFVCNHDITSAWAVNCMTKNPITMVSSKTIEEAMEVFRHHSIGDIPIVNEMLVPIGMLSLKDLAKLI